MSRRKPVSGMLGGDKGVDRVPAPGVIGYDRHGCQGLEGPVPFRFPTPTRGSKQSHGTNQELQKPRGWDACC